MKITRTVYVQETDGGLLDTINQEEARGRSIRQIVEGERGWFVIIEVEVVSELPW